MTNRIIGTIAKSMRIIISALAGCSVTPSADMYPAAIKRIPVIHAPRAPPALEQKLARIPEEPSIRAQENPGNPNPLHLGVWGVEQKLLAMIREGNTNYSSALDSAATISTGVKMKTGDAIRQGKNSIITFVALCSRAAISGGLPTAVSYDLCDFYIEMTEGCKTISELAALSHTMYNDYVQRVHEYQKNTNVSKPIQTCRDYIRMHICEKISLQVLALVSGYSEYYLSRKFKKETGMPPNEFINHEKVEYAKLLLSTTPDSIQDISDTLNYCSRSYFSSVFQEHTGITPSEYREKNSTL